MTENCSSEVVKTSRSAAHRERIPTVDKASVAQTGRHEERLCRFCRGSGYVLLDAHYDATTGELKEEAARCPICEGAGVVSCWLYKHARRA